MTFMTLIPGYAPSFGMGGSPFGYGRMLSQHPYYHQPHGYMNPLQSAMLRSFPRVRYEMQPTYTQSLETSLEPTLEETEDSIKLTFSFPEGTASNEVKVNMSSSKTFIVIASKESNSRFSTSSSTVQRSFMLPTHVIASEKDKDAAAKEKTTEDAPTANDVQETSGETPTNVFDLIRQSGFGDVEDVLLETFNNFLAPFAKMKLELTPEEKAAREERRLKAQEAREKAQKEFEARVRAHQRNSMASTWSSTPEAYTLKVLLPVGTKPDGVNLSINDGTTLQIQAGVVASRAVKLPADCDLESVSAVFEKEDVPEKVIEGDAPQDPSSTTSNESTTEAASENAVEQESSEEGSQAGVLSVTITIQRIQPEVKSINIQMPA